jgi:formylglycine-generating enzyme required for sulfatase activity
MRNKKSSHIAQRLGFIALIAVIGFSMAACGDGSGDTAVTFSSASADGSASQTSTELTLVFSQAITGLSADDITLSGVSGVSKGALTNTGATYTLPISGFTAGGTLNIAVSKTGYAVSGSPKTATIYYVISIEMVQIQGGTFQMGSPGSEPDRSPNETQHSVTLTGFKMSKHPVTQAQYEAVTGNNPSNFNTAVAPETSTANRPVEMVTWYDAIEFCNKLSTQEGLTPVYTITGRTPATGYPITGATVTADWSKNGYRLPTEAQWEYACRAGTGTPFNTGNNITTDQANYDGNDPYNGNPAGVCLQRTTEVGSYAANTWSLYDMHGNVREWCWDWWGNYASGTQTDPTGAVSGSYRVGRGGSWDCGGLGSRSAYRDYGDPRARYSAFGFRLVRPAN